MRSSVLTNQRRSLHDCRPGQSTAYDDMRMDGIENPGHAHRF